MGVSEIDRYLFDLNGFLVLRDVLGFSTVEVAEMLDTTEVAIKGVLQRARASLERWRQTSGARSAGSATETPEVVRRFAEAFAADDVDGVVTLLTADAWLTMPPAPHEYEGIVAIADFLRASATWRAGRRFQLLTASANGQPAFACYLAEASEKLARPAGLLVLTVTGARIAAITRFLDVSLFTDFRLPDTIPAAGSARRDEQQLAGGAPSL